MTATTTGSSTMSDFLTKLRSEHRKAHRSASDETWDQQPMCFVCQTPWPCDAAKAADEIERLRAALREIRALHQPEWASEQAKAAGKEPWVCALCGTADGGWPCSTVATIREVLGDE